MADAQQYLTLYLGALMFALLATWPTQGGASNDAWFTLAYVRAAGLGLLGLGFGVATQGAGRRDQLVGAAMLTCFALLGLPLELAAYAASYPATPLSWVLVLPVLSVIAMYALGLPVGRLLHSIRLTSLAPLVVPALLGGMVALDLGTGVSALNPITAAVRVSLHHLVLLLVAVGCLALVWLRPLRGSPVNRGPGGAPGRAAGRR
jgi:hypothetical protein